MPTEFFQALIQHEFLQRALFAGLLASVACGVIGSYVVVKRIGYLAGGIAHAVLGGMGAALLWGFDPMGGALVAAVISALLIGLITQFWRTQEDILIGAVWAVGMSLGILLMTRVPGYSVDLMGYLFGNILVISDRELAVMIALNGTLLGIVALLYRQLLAVVFDEEFARLRGIAVTAVYLLLLCMVAVTVVMLIQVVGLILVIALLSLPAAIAGQFFQTLGRMMLVASLLGAAFTSTGLALAYAPDLPVGPTIVLVAGVVYVVTMVTQRAIQAWRRRRARSHRLAVTPR
ncbi:MAG: metal ABC transporter permease [Thiotrichales bacterium]